jgi:PKD repeat protein
VPPDSGPIAEFEATPRAGEEPLSVNFAFVEVTTGVTYTDWEWDLDGDGVVDDTGQTASHNYPDPGTYDVTLTVTDSTGATHSQTKEVFIVVSEKICVVPDFANVRRNSAQGLWSGAGFTTTVNFLGGNGNYAINQQTLTGGTVNPQPDGCDSQITVGP